jgi:hypothetical protein
LAALSTFITQTAMRSAMEVHEEELRSEGTYMLYNVWGAFSDFFRPPRPDLFHEPWQRVRQAPRFISQAAPAEPQSDPSPLQPADLGFRISARRLASATEAHAAETPRLQRISCGILHSRSASASAAHDLQQPAQPAAGRFR